MNEPEAFKLLTLASARDGRKVSQAVARVWADDLVGVDLGEAVEAVRLHYTESSDWLMPSHVIKGVRRVREAHDRQRRRTLAIEPQVITFPGKEWWDREVAAAIEAHKAEKNE